MAATFHPTRPRAIHPLHAVLLAGTVPLFLGALLSDITYSRSYQIQWSNFASWLIVGAMVFCGIVLALAIIDLFREDRRGGRTVLYFLLVLATFVLGFINALVHAQDAWAIMPEAVWLSVLVFALACAATWVGFLGYRAGGVR